MSHLPLVSWSVYCLYVPVHHNPSIRVDIIPALSNLIHFRLGLYPLPVFSHCIFDSPRLFSFHFPINERTLVQRLYLRLLLFVHRMWFQFTSIHFFFLYARPPTSSVRLKLPAAFWFIGFTVVAALNAVSLLLSSFPRAIFGVFALYGSNINMKMVTLKAYALRL